MRARTGRVKKTDAYAEGGTVLVLPLFMPSPRLKISAWRGGWYHASHSFENPRRHAEGMPPLV